ncbi:hypothetical protein AAC387_Pa09g0991 [Persea americana]
MGRLGPSRIWPTASHWKRNAARRRVLEDEPCEEPKVSEDAGEEVEAIDEHGQPDDAADIGGGDDEAQDIGPFLGVPFDFTLLSSFRNHIATAVWKG